MSPTLETMERTLTQEVWEGSGFLEKVEICIQDFIEVKIFWIFINSELSQRIRLCNALTRNQIRNSSKG